MLKILSVSSVIWLTDLEASTEATTPLSMFSKVEIVFSFALTASLYRSAAFALTSWRRVADTFALSLIVEILSSISPQPIVSSCREADTSSIEAAICSVVALTFVALIFEDSASSRTSITELFMSDEAFWILIIKFCKTSMNWLIPLASCPISSPVLSATRRVKSPRPDSMPLIISSKSVFAFCAGRTTVLLIIMLRITIITISTNTST